MDKKKIEAKVTELKATREQLVAQANNQLAHISGQIEALENLLKEDEEPKDEKQA